jgi:hypothetical protein
LAPKTDSHERGRKMKKKMPCVHSTKRTSVDSCRFFFEGDRDENNEKLFAGEKMILLDH